jgi:putative ABC transport system substrate-binding protein
VKTLRVGALWADTPADLSATFAQALVDLGHAVGPSFAIEMRWVRARSDVLPDAAAELVRLNVDAIVAPSTPAALAAKQATDTIPIVMVATGDPVAARLVASLARPGGNVTGLSSFTPQVSQARVELLREAFPGVARAGVLWNSADPGKTHEANATQTAAQALGLPLLLLPVHTMADVDGTLQGAGLGATDALIVLGDALTHSCRAEIVRIASQRKLPTLFDRREYYVDEGGLMAYGPSFPELFRRSAAYVDRILTGARPADLPVERPARADLILNLNVAQSLGLTIPRPLLLRATEVLQ